MRIIFKFWHEVVWVLKEGRHNLALPSDSPRPVIVRLHRRDIVDRILKMTRNRKYDKSQLRIVPHLPQQLKQNRIKLCMIAHKKFLADNSAKIKVKSDHVEVNGVNIKDNI